jgi:hypothetical protein
VNAKATQIQDTLRGSNGISKLLSRREIKELPSILWEDELPEAIITGLYKNNNGLLVATNRRAIFIDKGWVSLTVEDFPYDKISSIEYHTGLLAGGIDIYASGNKAEIKSVPKDQVRPFAERLRSLISHPMEHHRETTANPQIPDDRINQLERLATLKAQGIINEDEFEAEKKRILGN